MMRRGNVGRVVVIALKQRKIDDPNEFQTAIIKLQECMTLERVGQCGANSAGTGQESGVAAPRRIAVLDDDHSVVECN